MKQLLFIIAVHFLIVSGQSQSVGIGTITPSASAQLDVTSTTKGFLPPRMTIEQRDAVVPVTGLMIYCIDDNGISGEWQGYNGIKWVNLCGGEISITKSVVICSQNWAKKNLDVAIYRNGDSIPNVIDPEVWKNLTTGAYCYYNNDSISYGYLGKLYNWYAVNDPRGLSPLGWHIPSDDEWKALESCLGGTLIAGGAIKEIGVTNWTIPNTRATNKSGFSALPGGSRNLNGPFQSIRDIGRWWSSTPVNTSWALDRFLLYNDGSITTGNQTHKRSGFSIRCIKD